MAMLRCRSGTWYIAWTEDGAHNRYSLKTRDEAVAKAALRQLELRLALKTVGCVMPSTPSVVPPISDLIPRYAALRHEQSQGRARGNQLKTRLFRIVNLLGWKSLDEITVESLRAYYFHPDNLKLADETLRFRRAILHGFWKWCQANRWVDYDPFPGFVFKGRGIRGKINRGLNREELMKLLSHPDKTRRVIYTVLAHTGLRRIEAERLRWEHVKDDGLYLDETVTKSGKRQFIPFTAVCKQAFDYMRTTHEHEQTLKIGLVFSWVWHLPLCGEWRKDLAICGIQYMNDVGRASMHKLRETLSTLARESGMQPDDARIMLRHASVDTTIGHYERVSNEEIAARFRRALSGVEPPDLALAQPKGASNGTIHMDGIVNDGHHEDNGGIGVDQAGAVQPSV